MSPIDVPHVSTLTPLAYIGLGAVAFALLFLLGLLALYFYSRSKKNEENGERIDDLATNLLYTVLISLGVAMSTGIAVPIVHQYAVDDVYDAAMKQLEQETGVIIMDDLDSYILQEEKNSVPVTFKHEGNIYEGLIVVREESMVIHVPNTPEDERQMVLFEG